MNKPLVGLYIFVPLGFYYNVTHWGGGLYSDSLVAKTLSGLYDDSRTNF
jgi:hypothetical protein